VLEHFGCAAATGASISNAAAANVALPKRPNPHIMGCSSTASLVEDGMECVRSLGVGADARVGSGRGLDHLELRLAGNPRCDFASEIRGYPFAPVGPPRARVLLRTFEPRLGFVGQLRARPVAVLVRGRRIDHACDVALHRDAVDRDDASLGAGDDGVQRRAERDRGLAAAVPDPHLMTDAHKREAAERALAYMGLTANMPITDIKVDHVFIGSCTNGRIEDLRAAAVIAKGKKVAAGVNAIVVPGSGLVKEQAEEEGLDKVFLDAGFEWRDPGCSMCLAMNADKLKEGERCASTSNRNFEGRQGRGGRTHLVSPAMAAAAAVTGRLTDVRKL